MLTIAGQSDDVDNAKPDCHQSLKVYWVRHLNIGHAVGRMRWPEGRGLARSGKMSISELCVKHRACCSCSQRTKVEEAKQNFNTSSCHPFLDSSTWVGPSGPGTIGRCSPQGVRPAVHADDPRTC